MAALPTAPIPQTVEESSTLTGENLEARVIVYNCDCHTYQQVIDLLCRAVPKMTAGRAFELAYRIDPPGQAGGKKGSLETGHRSAATQANGALRSAARYGGAPPFLVEP